MSPEIQNAKGNEYLKWKEGAPQASQLDQHPYIGLKKTPKKTKKQNPQFRASVRYHNIPM